MADQFLVLVIEGDKTEAAQLRQLLDDCAECGQTLCPIQVSLFADTAVALANYPSLRPDLVIFGPLAALAANSCDLHRLRTQAGLEPVPILSVMSEREAIDSNRLLTGFDDILLKPYRPNLVQLKLAALQRFCDFNRSLMAQRNRIRRHHADLLQEQAGAREIFDKMGHQSCLGQTDDIRYHLSPGAVLNGDVLTAAYGPGGKLMLLLGDFTGHGLAAAVGAVPLTSMFYSMVPRGFSLGHILQELNTNLHRVLPAQMFCCAAMFELDPHKRQLHLFNGGMPSACLRRRNGDLRLLGSRHLPLGVMERASVDEAVIHIPVEEGDRLYLWSDGIHEARGPDGELFGERRLLQLLSAGVPKEQRFSHILESVSRFSGRQQDDLSLVEVAVDKIEPWRGAVCWRGAVWTPDTEPAPEPARLGDWSINFTLGPEELRDADPLPLLHSVLAHVPGAGSFHDPLTIVLGELFRNALEHGLLQLDSALKETEQGFAEYYRLLRRGRHELREGWIRVELRCHDHGGHSLLEVVVEDSGPGLPERIGTGNAYSGRGLPLLRAICRKVEIRPGSSRVRAELHRGGSGAARGTGGPLG